MSKARKRIDWESAKKRLRESDLALEQVLITSPERLHAAFLKRAAQLAARTSETTAGAAARSVLCFTLGQERYGIVLSDLSEIMPMGVSTPVPGAPTELIGVINLRGEIRAVLDLGRLLSLPT